MDLFQGSGVIVNKHNNVCISFGNFGCEQISFVKSKGAPRLVPLNSARGNEKKSPLLFRIAIHDLP